MIEAIIVDDEAKAIQGLAWELSNFSSEIEIINTFTSPEEALDYENINQPDCLF